MEPYLAATLGGLSLLAAGVIIALLRNLNKKSGDHDQAFARLEAILTGPTGDNGLCGDVKAVKERTHDLSDDMQFVFLKLGVERRAGRDRRASA